MIVRFKITNTIINSQNPAALFLFLIKEIYAIFIKSLIISISLCLLIICLTGWFILNIEILSMNGIVSLFLFILVYPIFVGMEEYCHCAVLIQLSYSRSIQSLEVMYLENSQGTRLFPLRISIVFRRTFSDVEYLLVLLGGPLSVIVCLTFINTSLQFIYSNVIIKNIFFMMLIVSFFPLIPFNKIIHTDGHEILRISRTLNIKFKSFLQYSAYCLFLVISYTFNIRMMSSFLNKDLHRIKYLAWKYVQKNQFAEAAEILESAFQINPEDPEVCNNLAYCYLMLNCNMIRAKELACKAIQLDNQNESYQETFDILKDF